jgi:ribonuclease Z
MVPTKERNQISVGLEYQESLFLFDCGENTQAQIKKMKLSIGKIKKIFLSHWHGDHVLGLNGLVQTLSNTDNVEKIEIHGPKNSKKYVNHMLKSTIFQATIKIEVFEHEPEENELLTIFETQDFMIQCAKLNHSVPCNGYVFHQKMRRNIDKAKAKKYGLEESPLLAQAKLGKTIEHKGKKINAEELTYEKEGKKISFVFDTRPCQGIDLLSKDADYLIMEATFSFEKHAHKAEEYDHMSAKETAEIARQNHVKNLVITHYSQRYKDSKDLEAEAREQFENTIASYDLMTLPIK